MADAVAYIAFVLQQLFAGFNSLIFLGASLTVIFGSLWLAHVIFDRLNI